MGDRPLRRILAYGLAVRLVVMPFFSDSLNFYGYTLVTTVLQRGFNPYQFLSWEPMTQTLAPWGYPGLDFIPSLVAVLLSFGNGFFYGLWIRVPLVIADLVTSAAIFHIVLNRGESVQVARRFAALYVLNPFVIVVSAIWGTNDSLAVLFPVLGLFFLTRTDKRADLAALCFGWGIAIKLFPAVLVPLAAGTLRTWSARGRFIALAAVPSVITAVPFLIGSPGPYLRTLLFFSASTTQSALLVWGSTWWLLKDTTGFLSPLAVIITLALFGGGIFALSWLVARRRISLLCAATVSLLGIFLVAPRLVQNYFLWPMPFVLLSAALEEWPLLWRRIAMWAWMPLLGTALIFNGRLEVAGVFYWLLISTGKLVGQLTWPWIALGHVLMLAFLVFIGASITALLYYSRRGPARPEPSLGAPNPPDPVEIRSDSTARTVVAASIVLFVVFALLLNANHRPVLPEDFGSYSVTPTEVTFSDDFHSTILGYTWQYVGTAPYRMEAGGGLVLDTQGVNASAAFLRYIPNGPTNVSMVATIEDIYGAFVQLARFPTGWVGVEPNRNPSKADYLLDYRDEATVTTSILGTVQRNVSFAWSASITANSTILKYNATTLVAPGNQPIADVEFGATDVSPVAGGREIIRWVGVSFANRSSAISPLSLPGEIIAATAAIGITTQFWKRSSTVNRRRRVPKAKP